ncbi:MAG: PAS domain S-box protein [Acidobacteria bacterium]|nr:PAS domain S-box protein [Acidobacteriota bacterium]
MSRPFVSGLRGRLLLLIVLATLPAFALTFLTGWRDRQRQRAEVAAGTMGLARQIAADQERIIDGTRQILFDLAQVPEVREGDPARSRTFFAILMKQYRGYASFAVVAPNGDVLASLPRSAEPVNFADRDWFREAVGERRFAVGDYQVGQLTKTAVLVAAWPAITADGTLTSVITAALDVRWLNEIAAASQLPPGGLLLLVDRRGQVIARHPEGEGWIGRHLPNPSLSAVMKDQAEGVVEAADPDTLERIYAFTPIRGRANTELRVVIGVPRETAYAAVNQLQTRQLIMLALVIALTLAGAWVFAERWVLRRVASLLDATRKLAAGDRSVRTRLPYGHTELGELARAFDEMAGALETRQAERDRAEQALRASDARFRAFMAHSPAIAFIKDEAGRYEYANAAFERFLGIEPDGWAGRTDEDFFSPEAARALSLATQALGDGSGPRQTLQAVRRRDGTEASWLLVTFPLGDPASPKLAGMAVDLTDSQQMREALRRSEQQYATLVEQAADGIVITDAGRRLVAVNSAVCAMSGYSPDELIGRPVDDLFAPGSLAALLDRTKGDGLAGAVPEIEAVRKDGGRFPAEVSLRLSADGSVQAIVRDVTARYAAEAALRASEERFRRLYQYLPLAYQSLSPEGVILEVNEEWVRLMGLPREHAVGRRFDEMLPASGRARFGRLLTGLSGPAELRDIELEVVRATRPAAVVRLSGRLGHGAGGAHVLHCVLQDVTAARAAAARVRESEARYRSLFDDSSASLWEEDFSGIKRHLDRLRALGVTDLEAHFDAHPEELADCVGTVRVVDVNRATLAMYGAETRAQMLGGLDQIIGPDGYEVFRDGILALARGERSWQSEAVNYTLGGDQIVVALRWSLAPGAEESWSRVLVSAMDVTEQRRAESALRETQALMEQAFRLAPGLMTLSTRFDGRYVDVNDAFLRELGYSRSEVVGRTASQLGLWVEPGARERLIAQFEEAGHMQNAEVRLRRRSGAVLDGLCSIAPLVVGGEPCLLIHIVDVTAWKRAERAGRESERMLSTLMSNLPGMVYRCSDDPEWTMSFVSEGCRALTGYEPHELVGNRRMSYGRVVLEEDRDAVINAVTEGVHAGRSFEIIYRIRRRDGAVRWVWEQGRAVGSGGGGYALEGFIADISSFTEGAVPQPFVSGAVRR